MIKKASINDINAILSLLEGYGNYSFELLRSIINDSGRHLLLVDENSSGLTGLIFIEFNRDFNSAIVLDLFVKKSERNQGIAKLLKAEAESVCKTEGISQIRTFVSKSNTGMQELNKQLGYSQKGELLIYSKTV